MHFTLDTIAQRLVICRASDISHTVADQDIGGIITATHENVRGLSDFNFDSLPTMVTALHALSPYASRTESADAVITDLHLSEQLFHDIGEQKLLVHCSAGISNSPMFALMLLLHLSGDTGDKNLDKAIGKIHQIAPHASYSQNVNRYRDYLGERFQVYQHAVSDYAIAKSLSKNDDEDGYRRQLTQIFRGISKPTDREVSRLYDRFGIKPVAFTM